MRYNKKTPTNLYFVLHALPRKPVLTLRVIKFALARFLGRKVVRGIDLAVTYFCNLRCAHCNVAANHAFGERQELNENEIIQIICQLQKIGGFYVTFTGGEPLIRIELIERVIKRIGKRSMLWQVQSNGVILNDEICQRLKSMGVDNVQLSFDTYHEAQSWEDVVNLKKNQVILLRRYKLRPIFTWLASHKTVGDSKQVRDILNFSVENKVVIGWNFAVSQGRWQDDTNMLLTSEDSTFIRKIAKQNKYIYIDLENNLVDYGCPAFSERFHINAYGDVQPCTFFQISFGNIREEPLRAIWQRGLQFPLFAQYPPNCPPAEDKHFIKRWFEMGNSNEIKYPIPYQDFFEVK